MSIGEKIVEALPGEISTIRVNKSHFYHGENAVEVIVGLQNGKMVTGTFTNQPKSSFGGVEFSQQKDIAGLMIAKIKSVIAGTAE